MKILEETNDNGHFRAHLLVGPIKRFRISCFGLPNGLPVFVGWEKVLSSEAVVSDLTELAEIALAVNIAALAGFCRGPLGCAVVTLGFGVPVVMGDIGHGRFPLSGRSILDASICGGVRV